jgi:hypothetical protein
MRPPGEDSLVSVKEASQKYWDVDLLTLILRHVHCLTTKLFVEIPTLYEWIWIEICLR